jgi:CRISPR-associated protein Cas1
MIEEFRAIIVDAVVFKLVFNDKLTPEDFTFPGMTGKPCYLNKEARVRFIGNLESKLNAAITHPVSEEQLDYRRCIEHQVQELAGVIRGRRERYRPMVLR